jgi:hypothetical protein
VNHEQILAEASRIMADTQKFLDAVRALRPQREEVIAQLIEARKLLERAREIKSPIVGNWQDS